MYKAHGYLVVDYFQPCTDQTVAAGVDYYQTGPVKIYNEFVLSLVINKKKNYISTPAASVLKRKQLQSSHSRITFHRYGSMAR